MKTKRNSQYIKTEQQRIDEILEQAELIDEE